MTKTIYLPGAGGSASFWQPVAAELGQDGVFLAWPGLGNEPPSPGVTSIDDMVAMVLAELREPANLIAQSMGGLVAIKAALARPSMVKSLVLAVTSAGVPVADLGGLDWRSDYYAAYPNAARWIAESREDCQASSARSARRSSCCGAMRTPSARLRSGNGCCPCCRTQRCMSSRGQTTI